MVPSVIPMELLIWFAASNPYALKTPSPLVTDNRFPLCVIFTATPQGLCSTLVNEEILSKVKIIDLSADFRIKDVAVYEKWYKLTHGSPEYIKEAVYGLPEVTEIKLECKDHCKSGMFPHLFLLIYIPVSERGTDRSEHYYH